jgi:hypothetical protein
MRPEFDPRMFISAPFTDCPECRQPDFGTLMVSNNHWTRRCRECWHTASKRLPTLAKRAIYLDQMALSNMAKSLDPVWRAQRGEPDPYWIQLFEQLERLVKLQVLACPASPVHEEESAVTPYADVLRRLREYLASGVSLHDWNQIIRHQLYNALRAAESDAPITRETYLGDGLRAVVHGRLDEWSDRLTVTVNFAILPESIQSYRSVREQMGAALASVWTQWVSVPRSFEQQYEQERHALYEGWCEAYNKHRQRFQRMEAGLESVDIDAVIPSAAVQSVSWLLDRFLKRDMGDHAAASAAVVNFLRSEAALSAPANNINALLFAALARKAATGQKKVPGGGTAHDVRAISSYLPYCDAMFVDDHCAGLLRDEPIATRLRPWGARVFSNRTRDAFLEHLSKMEAAVPADHVALVQEVYGDSWLVSFRTILESARNRRGDKSVSESGPTTPCDK